MRYIFGPGRFNRLRAICPLIVEILDRQEQERMQRFHFAADSERYAVAHGNLRRILGAYLNLAPERLCFRNNQFGKPELAGETSLKFSLSHSKSIAVSGSGPRTAGRRGCRRREAD